MINAVESARLRTALATLGVATLLAVLGFFLPGLNLRTMAWGAVAGLLFPLILIAPRWLTRAQVRRPEDIREMNGARKRWAGSATWAAVIIGGILGFLAGYSSANVQAAMIGFVSGMVIFTILLTGPEYWLRIKPERSKSAIPFEPVEDSNRSYVTRSS